MLNIFKLLSSLQSHWKVWRSEFMLGSQEITPSKTYSTGPAGARFLRQSGSPLVGPLMLEHAAVILPSHPCTWWLHWGTDNSTSLWAGVPLRMLKQHAHGFCLLTLKSYISFSAQESGKLLFSFSVSGRGRCSRRGNALEWMLNANPLNYMY